MTSTEDYDTQLTLAIPLALEEEILDFLLLHPHWAGGFSILDAHGMGQGASLASAMEKVQGRCRRKLVLVLGRGAELRQLLAALRGQIRNGDAAYWFTPASGYGRLA